MSNIILKLRRAKSMSMIGQHHDTFAAMAQHVDRALAETLTSRQLAGVIDNLYDASQAAQAIARRAVIEDSGLWDGGLKAFLALDKATAPLLPAGPRMSA